MRLVRWEAPIESEDSATPLSGVCWDSSLDEGSLFAPSRALPVEGDEKEKDKPLKVDGGSPKVPFIRNRRLSFIFREAGP